jgi:hypothetical protein
MQDIKPFAVRKARVAIRLSEVMMELRHLERCLASIDAVEHADSLADLERELSALKPRLIAFLRNSLNAGVIRRHEAKPRDIIRGLTNRIYAHRPE